MVEYMAPGRSGEDVSFQRRIKRILHSWNRDLFAVSVEVVNVYFISVNFHTTLYWDAVCDLQCPCTYKVKYKAYGDEKWTNKTDCWGTQNFCNMTTEILEKNHAENYMVAKVSADAGNVTSWKKSKLFMPIRDTNISVPDVSISTSANSIVVYISTPPLLYFNTYPEKRRYKKVSFIIAVSNKLKLLWTNVTMDNVLKFAPLSPDHYCISVKMKFEERTSDPSETVCVNLKDLTAKEVILGSTIAVCVSIVIAVILGVYLIVYRHLLHPKAHLPSNLILNNVKTKSNASDYKSDETFLASSIFEGMEFCKHTLESDNSEGYPQNKRYVSTEAWRKDYVNFRHKYTDPNFPLSKTVELRNSTYGTSSAEGCLLDYPTIGISPESRYIKAKECLPYGHICNENDYYNGLIPCEQSFKKPSQPYFNQEEKSNCFYMNDQFQAYINISGNA
ncbi:interleukin-20 receptor subunit alpha-like [Mantella aurantiaca]